MRVPFLMAILAGLGSFAPARGDEIDERMDALLRRMTLEERVGQLEQVSGKGETGASMEGQLDLVRRGKIGSFLNVRGVEHANRAQKVAVEESPSRVPLLFGFDVTHGYRTIFPVPLEMASSWDPASLETASRIAAEEASSRGVR